MYPNLFGVEFLHMYGLMIAIGLIACFVFLEFLCSKQKVDKKFVTFMEINGVVAIAGGFGFAALFQSFYEFIENPAAGFKISGNITFFGGLIGGVTLFLLGYFLFGRKYQSSLKDILTIAPISIVVAHAFGRIGCFCAGCCYGKPTDSFWGVKFPGLDHAVYPTQLFEALFLFVLFGIMLFLILKYKFKYNLPLYCVGYGVFRFLIEFIRGDSRGEFVGTLSPSQFWSIAIVLVGVVLWVCLCLYYNDKLKLFGRLITPNGVKKLNKLIDGNNEEKKQILSKDIKIKMPETEEVKEYKKQDKN